ncbi:MAG TPA: glycoside hydrolase family 32 protein, partial [Tepidisphaeraceae bacterium]
MPASTYYAVVAAFIFICASNTVAQPADPQRPTYHFLPPKGWMNDPNGLIQFKGQFHLFYQHNDQSAVHNKIVWGHAVSPDLVHWEHRPIALRPDKPYDAAGAWSGCAIENNGVVSIFYTGVQPETQCLVTSPDLVTFEKHPSNPIIPAPPAGVKVTGFRDPCVWKDGDTWLMVVGTGVKDVGGALALYRSRDGVKWDYVHIAAVGDKAATGEMWECPQLFAISQEKHVLVVSPYGRSLYMLGTWKDLKFTPESRGEIDLGGALYAPQVFPDEKRRLIMFGWLWENRQKAEQHGWQGVQSLPRVLTLGDDGRVNFEPAEEVKTLRREHRHLDNVELKPDTPQIARDVQGEALELAMEINPGKAEQVALHVRCSPDEKERTSIVFDRAAATLSVDRSR